jgi:ribosome-binding factor A
MVSRIDKINELIREQVSLAIYKFCSDKFVSISSVDTSRDLSYCDIMIVAPKDQDEIVKMLKQNCSEIRSEISKKISLRKMPKIRFHLDDSYVEADRINKLLEKI